MARLLIIGKVALIGSLIFVFLKYFGLVSLQKYQSKNVFVTKSWDRPDFLPLPVITICPSHVDSGHAFKNVTEEQKRWARKEGKGLLEVVCDGRQGTALTDCIEREVFGLSDIVTFEETHATTPKILHHTVEKNPIVSSRWSMSLNHDKGPCFTYQNDQHMETQTMLKIGLNASFKYHVSLHDPKFFIRTANPAMPVRSSFLNAGDWEMIKLVIIEHQNLDVPDKKCSSGQNYSLTECVTDVFSGEAGCALHWNQKLSQGSLLPKCTTQVQHRQLQAKFDSIKYLTLLEVSNMTGCFPPCFFDEYRYQLVSKVEEKQEMSQLIVWNTSPYLLVEKEKLVYTLESLVAEFGGTLGLFLGFSFLNLWDVVEIAAGVVPAVFKLIARIFR